MVSDDAGRKQQQDNRTVRAAAGPARGILNPDRGSEHFTHARIKPGSDLERIVEHFWTVRWDLRGKPSYRSETLPHPSVHIVLERGRSEIIGVMRGKFWRTLEDEGRVFGIKFKPGAFAMLSNRPVSEITDRRIPFAEYSGIDAYRLEQDILSLDEDERGVEIAEDFLRQRLGTWDDAVAEAGRVVAFIAEHKEIAQVEDLAERLGYSVRTIQRLFGRYVGVSPKWVIRRYRLHEAADRLDRGAGVDFAALALDLGYYDQAHFVNDFRQIVGVTPAVYARQ